MSPQARAKRETFKLNPGTYRVAVAPSEEIDFEVPDSGEFSPSNPKEREAMAILGAKKAGG
jgi:hypothetical protein